MTGLRIGNTRHKKAERRRVYREAKAFHEERVTRLTALGRTDKLRNSAFVRRGRKRRVDAARWIRRLAPSQRKRILDTLKELV